MLENFFFRLIPTRGRHSTKVFSIRLGQLRLPPLLQPSQCLLSPNPFIFSSAFLSFFTRYCYLYHSFTMQGNLVPQSLSSSFAVCAIPLTYSFFILSFFITPNPISPFLTLPLPSFPSVFHHRHSFHSIKHGRSNNSFVHFTFNLC